MISNINGVRKQLKDYQIKVKELESKFIDSLNDKKLEKSTPLTISQSLYLSQRITKYQKEIEKLERLLK